jgi:hypothetical protein
VSGDGTSAGYAFEIPKRKRKKLRGKTRVRCFNLPSGGKLERLQAPAALFIAQKHC